MTRSFVTLALLAASCRQSAPAQEPVVDPAPIVPAGTGPACEAEITAQQHIVDHPCVLPVEKVGCMSADAACDDAITFARAPDNTLWWFMDTCIPDGWTSEPYPPGLSEPPPSC
jgi:hypothetical protein